LHGFAPFKGESINEVKHKMKIGDFTLDTDISEECKELIIMILRFDPEERASIEEIEGNKWVRKMERVLSRHYIRAQDPQIDFSAIKLRGMRKGVHFATNSSIGGDKNSCNIPILNVVFP
jgi:hypothetical protein